MIVNYKKSLIEAYFKDMDHYINLKFIEEPFFMGTAGGIQLLKQRITSNFFIVNCDVLVDFDYYQIWKKHMSNHNILTIVSAKKVITIPYGTIASDENDIVSDLIEKPQLTYHINTGMYLCDSKIIEYIKDEEKIDMPDLIKRCISAGERVGQVVIGQQNWYDMGQPKELELMKKRLHIT
jgi:NDP-sugar pyrophosphorylase family protein